MKDNRRSFLKMTGAIVGLSAIKSTAASERPNILFIPVDDLKPMLGCYGDKKIKTPNIDRLARRGTVFLNNACQQAVCGPSRASLMTGRYPDSTGVFDLATRMRDINADILSLPQYLQQNGYETTGLGKTYDPRCVDDLFDEPSWSIPYMGNADRDRYAPGFGMPADGFQAPETKKEAALVAKLMREQGIKGKDEKKKFQREHPGCHPATECYDAPDNAYKDGVNAEVGCEYLEKLARGKKPFFLSVGFSKPHLPFVAPKKYWDLYDRSAIELSPFQDDAKGTPEFAYNRGGELRAGYTGIPNEGRLPEAMQKELIHGYMACVSYTDAQIGKLLDKLDQLGLADKTIICLWGDHGWHLGDHSQWCKHSNFEQAARAPLIIAAPSQKAKGVRTESPSEFVDIFPTLVELVGLPGPAVLEGKSLTTILDNPSASVREAAMGQYPRGINGQKGMGYSLRSKRFRYVKWLVMDYYKGERTGLLATRELYDYKNDPYETVNLADNPEYAAVIEHFEQLFKERNVAQHTGLLPVAVEYEGDGILGPPDFNGVGKFIKHETVAVSGQEFSSADKIEITAKPPKISGAAYKRSIEIPLEKGVEYELSFYCRSATDQPIEFKVAIQYGKKNPYVNMMSGAVKAGSEWQQVVLTGVAPEDLPVAGNTRLTCHLGGKIQTVLIGPVHFGKK
jgi:iduronate 2-sulfatase